MSTNRSRRIDRDTAEQLLSGAVGGPSAGQDASLTGPDGPGHVARVLAAAAAPASAAELAGEEAALAAFRKASLAPDPVVTPVRRRSMATAALARAFSTKAAAAVLGATALCGVAVAAGTGNLPSPLGGGPSEPQRPPTVPGGSSGSSPGAPHSGAAGTRPAAPFESARPSGTASGGPQTAAPGTTGTGEHGARPSLPPALVPLCQGFTDRTDKGEHPRQLAADPLFAPLVAAAGGADGVAGYCDGTSGSQGATAQPSTPARTSPATDGGKNGGDNGKSNANGGSNGNANGGSNANGGGTNGQDGGGGRTKPGKNGVTAPTPPAPPTPPDIRPSRTVPSEDEQSTRR
ncbi:hypothetical protein ACGF07_17425 [Kitasatospora sp. NPDC048194]|uniref:hypothetical protein n=1 Tax=Kitasatospora sp. NPDC048194 TaxID=3364045 RepID=UPI0037230E03